MGKPQTPCSPQHIDHDEANNGHGHPHEVEVLRVEDCNDKDCADVVDDGQCQQEQLRTNRHPGSEDGHHANREGDVGGPSGSPQPSIAPGSALMTNPT